MSKLDPLTLPCASIPSDIMTVRAHEGTGYLNISIANEDDRANGVSLHRSVILDDAAARVLFNALAIYLHRKGPG